VRQGAEFAEVGGRRGGIEEGTGHVRADTGMKRGGVCKSGMGEEDAGVWMDEPMLQQRSKVGTSCMTHPGPEQETDPNTQRGRRKGRGGAPRSQNCGCLLSLYTFGGRFPLVCNACTFVRNLERVKVGVVRTPVSAPHPCGRTMDVRQDELFKARGRLFKWVGHTVEGEWQQVRAMVCSVDT
jgi:hypothetical protein